MENGATPFSSLEVLGGNLSTLEVMNSNQDKVGSHEQQSGQGRSTMSINLIRTNMHGKGLK
jgi:hypothetical protein